MQQQGLLLLSYDLYAEHRLAVLLELYDEVLLVPRLVVLRRDELLNPGQLLRRLAPNQLEHHLHLLMRHVLVIVLRRHLQLLVQQLVQLRYQVAVVRNHVHDLLKYLQVR